MNPFKVDRLKPSVLENLIKSGAEVLNIESDSRSFTHLTDHTALLTVKQTQGSGFRKSFEDKSPGNELIKMPAQSEIKLNSDGGLAARANDDVSDVPTSAN